MLGSENAESQKSIVLFSKTLIFEVRRGPKHSKKHQKAWRKCMPATDAQIVAIFERFWLHFVQKHARERKRGISKIYGFP